MAREDWLRVEEGTAEEVPSGIIVMGGGISGTKDMEEEEEDMGEGKGRERCGGGGGVEEVCAILCVMVQAVPDAEMFRAVWWSWSRQLGLCPEVLVPRINHLPRPP